MSCAEIIGRMSEFPRPVLELGIVGALFHDVGKIHLYNDNGNRLSSAHVIDHDDLTLEVLAGHLKELDNQCRDAGTALRYIWSWRRNRQNRRPPLITIAEAVLLADHISAGINAEVLAFGDRQHWQQTASLNERTRFWRPNLSRETALADSCRIRN